MSSQPWIQRLLSVLNANTPPPPELDTFWLPCRETEGRSIDEFLRSSLSTKDISTTKNKKSKSKSSSTAKSTSTSSNTPDSSSTSNKRALYIAGKPGTGKTASVTRILSHLTAELELPNGVTSGDRPKYHRCRVISINAASLLGNSKSNIFYEIARQVGHNITAKDFNPVVTLEKMFIPKRKPSKRTKMTIVMIDEIDALLTEQMTGSSSSSSSINKKGAKFQEALYRLFEWPQRKNSTLIIVAIANRIDLLYEIYILFFFHVFFFFFLKLTPT